MVSKWTYLRPKIKTKSAQTEHSNKIDSGLSFFKILSALEDSKSMKNYVFYNVFLMLRTFVPYTEKVDFGAQKALKMEPK